MIKNKEEMAKFAEKTGSSLAKKKSKGGALVLGLSGNLGSGKTTFTQFLALSFGIKERISSPTFVIEKIYRLPKGSAFENLIHIDSYRLESGRELLTLGWDNIVENEKNLIVVEWPEKVIDILPAETEWIKFEFVDEDTRRVICQE